MENCWNSSTLVAEPIRIGIVLGSGLGGLQRT